MLTKHSTDSKETPIGLLLFLLLLMNVVFPEFCDPPKISFSLYDPGIYDVPIHYFKAL